MATEQQERDQVVGREVILEQEPRAERRRRIDMEAQVTLADSWKAMGGGQGMSRVFFEMAIWIIYDYLWIWNSDYLWLFMIIYKYLQMIVYDV